jgi:uncharacterized protein YecE (DUF72 family)
MLRIGPAGWSYTDWAGAVYPKPRPRGFDPLAFMAGYFDMVELNTSFYSPISPHNAGLWLERTASNPHFRFTAKLWRRFTHERGSRWSAEDVRHTREGLDLMHEAGRLGAVLMQFPRSFRNLPENRDWLDGLVSTFQQWPLVLEVRHESWNEPGLFAELAERGVGFVNIDQPLFAHSLAPSARVTSPVGYVRIHGRNYHNWFRQTASAPERYDYLYSARELTPWVERTREIAAHPRVEDVYVVTNNHVRGKGVVNALMLQSMLTGQPVRAPQTLVREYPDTLGPYVLPSAEDTLERPDPEARQQP